MSGKGGVREMEKMQEENVRGENAIRKKGSFHTFMGTCRCLIGEPRGATREQHLIRHSWLEKI
jgi:hypothetical protein